MSERVRKERYCGMCERWFPVRVGKECPECGFDLSEPIANLMDALRVALPRDQHVCHDMQPPFAGPCAACEHERAEAEALDAAVYPTAVHAENRGDK